MKKRLLLSILLSTVGALTAVALTVDNLRVESLRNPSGIDLTEPQFSWQLQSAGRGVVQTTYQLQISTDAEGTAKVFDTGVVASSESAHVKVGRLPLQPATRYYWRVTVSDNKGGQATSDETAYFETGLLSAGWSGAMWIKSAPADSGTDPKDYIVEGLVRIEHTAAGLCFAMQDDANFYYWQLNTEGDYPRLRPHVWQNGNPACLADVDLRGKVELNNTDEFALRIVVTGASRARTYINNVLVDDRTGNFRFGRVGMREDHGERDGREEIGVYDDIRVSTPDGTVLFFEDFTSGNAFTGGTVTDDGKLRIVGATTSHVLVWQASEEGMPMFRKTFDVGRRVASAMLFTSGLGVYDVFMNGRRVGHPQPDGSMLYEELKPGWTDFRYRVFYSTHDVTALLNEGRNALSALVTTGWWAGAVMHGAYGAPELGFLAKLLIRYDDGSEEVVVSDLTWRSSRRGALMLGDIYDGEIYDARRADDWISADYDDSQWLGVGQNTDFHGVVEAFTGGYVQTLPDHVQQVRTATIYEGTKATGTDFGMANVVRTQQGEWTAPIAVKRGQSLLLDFGQNVVGWVSFKVKGARGCQLKMRFVEMLNDDGSRSRGNDGPGGTPYLANLRSAKASLYYTLSGAAEGEAYHPSTTFYGFRYCEVTPSDDVEMFSIEAMPISSSTCELGSLETSNALVNQLFSNITWGQRGNLLSVPTDCPQRDERLGWAADTQVFSRTGMFNADMGSFYLKWMQDMRDGQNAEGAYPGVAPECWGTPFGQCVWADAGILVPYNIYVMTGNIEALRQNYASMERYMDYLSRQVFDGYKYNGGGLTWGDWLSFVATDTRYIAVAYYALDAQLMAYMSRRLSEAEGDAYALKAEKYEQLYQAIKAEFRQRYITPTIRQNTQTAFLMALDYNLLEGDKELDNIKNRLRMAITRNKYKLNTGFAGTAILNTTLSRFGMTDLAYDLLLQRECPSWLYSVDQGATTIWERWNSYTRESGFGDPGMNSFNHYAYGAVGEWMYRYMLGIEYNPDEPGFRHIILQPQPDRRTTLPDGQSLITSASGHHHSYYGDIRSAWQAEGLDAMTYDCTVPANTTATLLLPAADEQTPVYESSVPAAQAEGVEYAGYADGCHVFRLGSGTYHFTTSLQTAVHAPSLPAPAAADDGPAYDLLGRPTTASLADLPSRPTKNIYIASGRQIVR